MMTDNRWIAGVDHRISTAMIFFLLLMLLGNRQRRTRFTLRAAASLLMMCVVSWSIHYVIDTHLQGSVIQGIGHSAYLLVMCLMFMLGYAMCYRTTPVELIYIDLIGLTVFKLAWNTFKLLAELFEYNAGMVIWSRYSIAGALVSYLVYAAVCLPPCMIYQRFVKKVPDDISLTPVLISYIAMMFCQIVLEFCKCVLTVDSSTLLLYYICALMYTMINYVALFTIMQLMHYRRDNEDMQNFIKNRMQYYEMSREGITSLQIKCHDLKHQIAMIRSQEGKESFEKHISRLEDSIIEYGTLVDCGNETINVVLTEKNILCSTCGVKFSYIIDGKLFDFMSEMEIYSLFGNALDNALESCSKVSTPEKRMISLKAASRGDMVVLHVENFFEEELNMVDGMPRTTKKGAGHGFGLRSIQSIAQKYGGVASVQAQGQIFKLNVLMKPSAVRA